MWHMVLTPTFLGALGGVALQMVVGWGHINLVGLHCLAWWGVGCSLWFPKAEAVCCTHGITSRAFSPSLGLLQTQGGAARTGFMGAETGTRDRPGKSLSENGVFAEAVWCSCPGFRPLNTNPGTLDRVCPGADFVEYFPSCSEDVKMRGKLAASKCTGGWDHTSECSWQTEQCNKLAWSTWDGTR